MTRPETTGRRGIELSGLPGESLTGFLAALGALRLLVEAGSDARLSWGDEAPYPAMLECPIEAGTTLEKRVTSALKRCLEMLDPFPGKAKLKEVRPVDYRQAYAAAAERPQRFAVDFLAALGSDAASRLVATKEGEGRKRGGKAGPIAGAPPDPEDRDAASDASGDGLVDPPWCVMDGAQQRNLFLIIRRLLEIAQPCGRNTNRSSNSVQLEDRVGSVLFGPWRSVDDKASLYLEPGLREHAYRWANPLTDPARFDSIANLLALVGLSLLPAVPVDRSGAVSLASACCASVGGGRVTVSWPLWHDALGLNAVRRLLVLPGLTSRHPPDDFAARGIGIVFRAEVFLLEKGARNYGFPQPVWRAATNGR